MKEFYPNTSALLIKGQQLSRMQQTKRISTLRNVSLKDG